MPRAFNSEVAGDLKGSIQFLISGDKGGKWVLFIADGNEHIFGEPWVENAKVIATCLEESQGDKIIVFKYKNKVRYRRKKGHRQLFSKLEIKDIVKTGDKHISKVKKEKAETGGKS